MTTVVRPQLHHPPAEDLADLARQMLALGWVVRAIRPSAAGTPYSPIGTLLVHTDPFGPPIATIRLLAHHRVELEVAGGHQVLVDDVEDLHHRLRAMAGTSPSTNPIRGHQDGSLS